jgi:hypothetical protein
MLLASTSLTGPLIGLADELAGTGALVNPAHGHHRPEGLLAVFNRADYWHWLPARRND